MLGCLGAQPQVHPLHGAVPERDVAERAQVEVGAELPVEHPQAVAHEGLGRARRVLVGRDQPVDGLDQVGAQQQPVAGLQGVGQGAEERAALLGVEVADRAAEEGDHPAAARGPWRQVREVQGEVADERLHRQPGVAAAEHASGVAEGLLGDVDRHEPFESPRAGEGVEQHPGLVGGAAAELDDGGRVAGAHHVAGVADQDRALGLGGVVLREPGDLVEESRALVVVEPLRGQ